MSSTRRSLRVQTQQAMTESLLDETASGKTACPPPPPPPEAESAGKEEEKPSRKRLRQNKGPSDEKNSRQENEELDDVGDPDFGDSDDEDENVASAYSKSRLNKEKEAEIPIKKKQAIVSKTKSSTDLASGKGEASKSSLSLSIPKKGNIPKRKQTEPGSQSLLLASLKPAPTPVETTTSTNKPTGNSSTVHASTARNDNGSSSRQAVASAPPASRAVGGPNKTGPLTTRMSTQVQGFPRHQERVVVEAQSAPSSARFTSLTDEQGYTVDSKAKELTPLQRQAMVGISDLCRDIREKDPRFASLGTIRSVDLGGSFLQRSNNDPDRYDFFDKNERGEIVLEPRKPMFPEDFPPGMREHTLAWWGILDPAVGDGKFRPHGGDYRSSPSPQQPRSFSRSPPRPDRGHLSHKAGDRFSSRDRGFVHVHPRGGPLTQPSGPGQYQRSLEPPDHRYRKPNNTYYPPRR